MAGPVDGGSSRLFSWDSRIRRFGRTRKNPTEETCAFFVAFSRAKQRVVFSHCDRRQKPVGTPAEAQERTTIGPLYELLQQAGVSLEMLLTEVRGRPTRGP